MFYLVVVHWKCTIVTIGYKYRVLSSNFFFLERICINFDYGPVTHSTALHVSLNKMCAYTCFSCMLKSHVNVFIVYDSYLWLNYFGIFLSFFCAHVLWVFVYIDCKRLHKCTTIIIIFIIINSYICLCQFCKSGTVCFFL